jgi:hypothetical protein
MGKGCRWGGQFMSNPRPRWTRSCHSKEGFQVSKGDQKREQGGISKGYQQGELRKLGDAPYICELVYVYITMSDMNGINNLNCV